MNTRNQITDLLEFIQKATKLGKYNPNTGGGLLNAVKVAERGLTSDEPRDIEYLASHIEELFFRQKELNLSPQSQEVYFARVKRAADDYKKYGQDARSIYSWTPKNRVKKISLKKPLNTKNEDQLFEEDQQIPQNKIIEESLIKEIGGVKINVVTWRLRPGVLIKIELPEDLTKGDVERMKRLLDLEIETF